MTNLMVDIETLNTTEDAIVLTIGAVLFDDKGLGEELYMRLDIEEQEIAGRTMNWDTLSWWREQNAKVREEAMGAGERYHPTEVLCNFNALYSDNGCRTIWSQGAFDVVIIEHMMKQFFIKPAWQFRHFRDARTVRQLFPLMKTKRTGHHNALEDAKFQARRTIKIYKKLGLSLNQWGDE